MTFCYICRDESFDYITTCGHFYHLECLRIWHEKNKSCPYCRNYLENLKKMQRLCEVCNSGISDFVTKCRHYIHERCKRRFNRCPVCKGEIYESQIKELILSRKFWTIEDLQTVCPLTLLEVAILACDEPRFYKKIPFKIVLETLLEGGFNINQFVFKKSPAPLIGVAGRKNNIQAIRELIAHGADLQRFGHFTIRAAVSTNDLDFLNYLIDLGVDPLQFLNQFPRFTLYSLDQENPAVFDKLLELGFDPNINVSGNTLLMYAAKYFNYNSLFKLIERFKLDVNAVSSSELTALIYAILNDDVKMIEILIKLGANLNIKFKGYNLFQYACYMGRLKAVKSLYKLSKPDLNALDPKMMTPLVHLIKNSDIEFIKYFIRRGADIKQIVDSGSTPLNFAFVYGRIDVAKYLLSLGCSLNTLAPGAERLPIHDIVKNWYYYMESYLKALLELGADINGLALNGDTALHYACKADRMELVKMLVLQYGANVNSINNAGQRPINVVRDLDDRITPFLLEHGSNPKQYKPPWYHRFICCS